jgi:hypothetical protein
MSTDLTVTQLDKARTALALAQDAVDAKRVADMAEAAEVLLKRQKYSEEVIKRATAIRVDALTLMGEFLKDGPKNKGTKGQLKGRSASGGAKREPPEKSAPTLAELGIDKKESRVAQALATIKTAAPDAYEAIRSGQKPVSRAPGLARKEQPGAPPKGKSAWKVTDDICKIQDFIEKLRPNWTRPADRAALSQFFSQLSSEVL